MNILLGISGSIAAYKSLLLCRLLTQSGHKVQVVTTQGAHAFVTAASIQALTGNPPRSALLDEANEAGMGHIELARWADAVLIAPASANLIARLAHGAASDLLSAICLVTQAPVFFAPAMNQSMWAHPLVQDNVMRLSQHYHLLAPDFGIQACGECGPGRMQEVNDILHTVFAYLQVKNADATPSASMHCPSAALDGASVVITAGATLEPIDPVRYLSNHSSGKMGFALANAFADVGARVVLICQGRLDLPLNPKVTRRNIQTAQDMHKAVMSELSEISGAIFVACAAVADYRVMHPFAQKIKKTQDTLSLTLIKNPDILSEATAKYQADILAIGFAAETHNAHAFAKDKLQSKRLDAIALNDVAQAGIGFGSFDNEITLHFSPRYGRSPLYLPKAPKTLIARQMVEEIGRLYVHKFGECTEGAI